MSDSELYFITMIEQALASDDPRSALINTLQRIETLGTQPGYATGYRQYQLWLQEHFTELERVVGSPLSGITNPPGASTIELRIELYCNDQRIDSAGIEDQSPPIRFEGLSPGDYVLTLDNGRRLWQSRLEAHHLLWSHAFPQRGLPLAAATSSPEASDSGRDTLRRSILDGEWRLRVQPGLEAGRLLIEPAERDDE